MFTCWVQVDVFHFRFHIFTLAAAVIEWGICWLLILLELIAGSGGVVFASPGYSMHFLSSFIFFGVQGAMERNCNRRHELKCFAFLRVISRSWWLIFSNYWLKSCGRIIHFGALYWKKGRKINRNSFLKLSTDRVLNECCRVWMFSLTDWIEVECFLEDWLSLIRFG